MTSAEILGAALSKLHSSCPGTYTKENHFAEKNTILSTFWALSRKKFRVYRLYFGLVVKTAFFVSSKQFEEEKFCRNVSHFCSSLRLWAELSFIFRENLEAGVSKVLSRSLVEHLEGKLFFWRNYNFFDQFRNLGKKISN